MTTSDADPEDFIQTIATMRAIRRFKRESVPVEDLCTMLYAATRAPSASNRQNFRFVILRDTEEAACARAILGREYRRCWSMKSEDGGYAAAAQHPGSRAARFARSMEEFVGSFEAIPVVAVACLIRYQAPGPLEGASIYPACQNLLLAARALGYGGVMTQWHTGVEGELRETLGIPAEVAISAVIALGRPEGHHGRVRRLPMRDLVYESRWNEPAPWARDAEYTEVGRAGPPRKEGPGG